MSFDGYMGGALPNPPARVQAREAAAAADGNICQSRGKTSLTWFCPECDDDVLIDIPSLIDSRDDALTALAERDAEIERLRAERDELLIRLAEYRQVNKLATDALEKYAARFGALS